MTHDRRGAAMLAVCAFAYPCIASAVPVAWADWTAADATSATGTIGGIGVGFSGNVDPPAQIDSTGFNYWAFNPGIYTAPGLDDGPPDADIIPLTGGPETGTQTITFAAPVTSPVMAILSLGQLGWLVTLNFDAEFDVLNYGPGFWGDGTLTELSGNVLGGEEGHGLVQFIGTFTSISFTIPVWESWYGFQIGVPGIARVAEPGTLALLALGALVGAAVCRRAPQVRRELCR